jgi:hypothetical protein
VKLKSVCVDRSIACGDLRIVDNYIVGWVHSDDNFQLLLEAFKEVTSVEFVARTGPRKEKEIFKECKVAPSIPDSLIADRFYVVVRPATTWECKAGKQRVPAKQQQHSQSHQPQHLQVQSSEQQQDQQQEHQAVRREGKDKASDVAVHLAPISFPKKQRLTLQGSYKKDCPAKISAMTLLFLDGRVSPEMTADEIKYAKSHSLAALKTSGRTTAMVERTYFAFPMAARHNDHLGEFTMRGNRMNTAISNKLHALVGEGVVTTHDVMVALKAFARTEFPLASNKDTRYKQIRIVRSLFGWKFNLFNKNAIEPTLVLWVFVFCFPQHQLHAATFFE